MPENYFNCAFELGSWTCNTLHPYNKGIHNYIPIIASDGIALDMLRKIPLFKTLELPYQISMLKKPTSNGNCTKYSKMMKAIWNEKKDVASWIKQYDIDGIISDNRLGVLTKMYPVYL
jgi:hypothetical protein